MRVYPEKLAANLESIKPIYVVSGDEPLLVQEACEKIRSALRLQGFSEREVHHVNASFDWKELQYSANSMSLFAERKIIELRMDAPKPGIEGAKVLKEYAGNPPEDNVLVLITTKVERSTQQSAWFKALDHAGVSVQIWPIEPPKLPNWLRERGRSYGLQIEREVAQLLADKVEGNLLAADQELQQLALLSESPKLSSELVTDGVQDSARYSIFALIDAAVAGQPGRVSQVLHGLQTEGTAQLFILSMLARELRSLIDMATEIGQGTPVDRAMTNRRVFDKRKPIVAAALNRIGIGFLEQLLVRTCEVDQMIKGIGTGNPWDELESILLSLAGLKLQPLPVG